MQYKQKGDCFVEEGMLEIVAMAVLFRLSGLEISRGTPDHCDASRDELCTLQTIGGSNAMLLFQNAHISIGVWACPGLGNQNTYMHLGSQEKSNR